MWIELYVDYERAAQNREMVKHNRYSTGYEEVAAILKSWPRKRPLPYWVPQGELPQIGKHEELYGMHEIE